MSDIRVNVSGTIAADAERVYRGLVDFTSVQPRLLPNNARDYRIVTGGVGEGTVAAFTLPVHGEDRSFSFRVAEPIPYRAITAYDHGHHVTITWRVRPVADTTELDVEVYWTVADSRFVFLTDWWAGVVVRRMLNQMLDRLPAAIADMVP
jgi:hypothetical protein